MSFLSLLRHELRRRVDIESEEELCRPPLRHDMLPHEWVEAAFSRRRVELLDGEYEGLITRQFLRREQWLEYTLRCIAALVEAETAARERIWIEGLRSFTPFTRWRLQLDAIVARTTAGTAISAEEQEREVRPSHVAEEAAAFVGVVRLHAESQEDALARTAARLEHERDQRDALEAREWNARFDLSEVYEVEWPAILREEAAHVVAVRTLLLWRVITTEVDVRYAIEADERDAVDAVHAAWLEDAPATATANLDELPEAPSVYDGGDAPPACSPASLSVLGHVFDHVPPMRLPGVEPTPPRAAAHAVALARRQSDADRARDLAKSAWDECDAMIDALRRM